MNHISRRQFIKIAAVAGLGLALPGNLVVRPRRAQAFYQSTHLPKFGPGQALRGIGTIPVAAPDAAPAPVTGTKHYTIDINQFQDQLHPSLGPTTLWGYHPANPLLPNVATQRHLGGIIVAQKDEPIQITFRNNLPNSHILPVDPTLMGADDPHQNRVSVHLHGGFVPWISDGEPFGWWAPDGTHGSSFIANQVLNPGAAPNEAEYYWPNHQSARFMWYHDHALGITRLNAYAGLATGYIVRDSFEAGLKSQGLPEFLENGGNEIPIVIQDKIFVNSATIDGIDPTWPKSKASGTLWYPHVYEGARWTIGPMGTPNAQGNLDQDPSIVAESFGDTMLANGTVFPVAAVEPRRYRIRLLNATQGRFLNLQLYVADNNPGGDGGITYQTNLLASQVQPTNAKGPDFLVIGTEGGFLSKPVLVNSATPFDVKLDSLGDPDFTTVQASLLTAPAERWDMIVDFKDFAGQSIILYNDAPAPFPMGDDINDYYLGNPHNPIQPVPGFGPNTRQIMRFDVAAQITGNPDPPLTIDTGTDLTPGIDPNLAGLTWTTQVQNTPPGVPERYLTLNEGFDGLGRLIQMLGTEVLPDPASPFFGRHYTDPATEVVMEGATEVWHVLNLTGDTHPMHFHLVNVQVLSRHAFPDPQMPTGEGRGMARNLTDLRPLFAAGTTRGPDPLELGWKETVHMNPGEVTSVIMKFALPQVPFTVPQSPRVGGHEYVWHCHILDHEEHDMMRPLIVTPALPNKTYLPSVKK